MLATLLGMRPRLLSSLLLLFPACAALHAQSNDTPPTVSGVVTRLASDTDFDVNGMHVVLTPETLFGNVVKGGEQQTFHSGGAAVLHLYLGAPVEVYGEIAGKPAEIKASRVAREVTSKLAKVSGSAVIDAVLPVPAGSPSGTELVRADGYAIRITPKTRLRYDKPLGSPADLHTNVWITYEGTQQPDGSVVASKALLSPNVISKSLDKARESWEYDPNAVASDVHQSGVDKAFRGIDPKQYPPYKDAKMQARVDRIGASLVPKYQQNFPYTETTRIDFRFYLVDAEKWRDAAALPNGIVLVPYQLVERMQNDSQLAAFLADKVACLLEKQPVPVPATDAQLATQAATTAALVTIPFAALVYEPVALPLGIAGVTQYFANERQRERVTLALLHDAGYDLTQAPVALWLLASKDPKQPITDIPLPRRSKYVYEQLGTTWAAGIPASAPAPVRSPAPAEPSAPAQQTAAAK